MSRVLASGRRSAIFIPRNQHLLQSSRISNHNTTAVFYFHHQSKAFKSTTSPHASVAESSSSSRIRNGLKDWQKVVNHPSVKAALPLIGNGAYLALVSGFLMTDMMNLRIALVGGYTGLVAFHSLHPKPLQIPLRWSAIFVFVNIAAVASLAVDRYCAPLSQEEEELYWNHFSQLSKGQFYQLLKLGTRKEVPSGTQLTKEGQVCPCLYFIEKGKAKVFHHGAFAAHIDEGGFVNDIAFQIGEQEGAYGTVITEEVSSIMVWDQHELRDHLKSRSDMDRNTKYLLSEHLMKSLLKQREARRQQQQHEIEQEVAAVLQPHEKLQYP